MEEVGEIFGIVRERARQIEEAALDKLYVDGRLGDWEHHTPSEDLHADGNWNPMGSGTVSEEEYDPWAKPIARFGEEGSDEEWCERMWLAYTGAR